MPYSGSGQRIFTHETFAKGLQGHLEMVSPRVFFSSGVSRRVNTEGRAPLVVPPPGASREGWKIIRALSGPLGSPLPYDDALALRDRMWEISPTPVRYDVMQGTSMEVALAGLDVVAKRTTGAAVKGVPFERPIKNFYMTDAISRASVTMAQYTKAFSMGQNHDFGETGKASQAAFS